MRTAVALITFAVVATTASAQPMMPQGPVMRPTVSPYVNLLGSRNGGFGGATASSFYGIVRPEQQFRQQSNALQQQLTMTNQNLNNVQGQLAASSDGTNPLITGKGSTFNNTSHYFNNLNGGGGSGGFGGMGGGSSGGFNMSRGSGSGSMNNMNKGIGQAPSGGRSKR
ncbi:hypothetical protein BH11PLA2_BH11PLA2_23770 [soil metagenome]